MIDKGALYRSIPKVDILLEKPEIIEASEKYGHGIVMDAIREQTDVLRKRIGELARSDIEGFLGTKVNLQTWVKVKESWRDSLAQLRNFGYTE